MTTTRIVPDPPPRIGLTAAELRDRLGDDSRRPKADELERWLLAEGFAVEQEGLLLPTAAAVEVGGLRGEHRPYAVATHFWLVIR